jgi:hypothetical protein
MAVTDILIGEASDPLAHEGDLLTFDTGWSLSELRLGDTPRLLQLTDQLGANLPATPYVYAQVSRPGYISCPPAVANGQLPIQAQGPGVATLTLTYDDPAGRVTKAHTITVI